ncbi:MAG: hypothetical protein KAQ67_09325 [Gammaproteobacteria bacterium]|nr:hypothetical protein [Gammaproteobacteria bacterium]
MKVFVNIVILSMIAAGGYYFYQQNKSELDKTLESVKNASVESVTGDVINKVKTIDSNDLLELAVDNKELIIDFMQENDINLENIDMQQLKDKLEENGISLENINLNDAGVEEKFKELIDSVKN